MVSDDAVDCSADGRTDGPWPDIQNLRAEIAAEGKAAGVKCGADAILRWFEVLCALAWVDVPLGRCDVVAIAALVAVDDNGVRIVATDGHDGASVPGV